VSPEVDEKRQLINLVLQNVRIEGRNVVWDVQKPFDLLVKIDDEERWRHIKDTFRLGQVEFGFSLTHIKTVYSVLKEGVNYFV